MDNMSAEYWLAEIDKINRPICVDGAHNDFQGAQKAFYLYKRLGLKKPDVKYAVVKVEILDLDMGTFDKSTVNEEAIDTLNSIGLK